MGQLGYAQTLSYVDQIRIRQMIRPEDRVHCAVVTQGKNQDCVTRPYLVHDVAAVLPGR
jgi:hypothetical protein